jgi:PAS domain S-box-containing protein
MKFRRIQSEILITVLYFLFGGLWILLSDRLLAWLVSDISTLVRFQTYKGWFFIVVSGLFLYFLLHTALNHERRTREELDETNEQFRMLFENSFDAVLLISPDGKIFSANPAACRMFGWSEAELCRLGREGIMDKSDRRYLDAPDLRSSTGHFEGEINYIRKNGEVFPCEISSVMFTGQNDERRSAVIARDISQRKRAETVLLESEAQYRQLAENINEVLILRDTRTKRVIYVNPAYEKVMGRSSRSALENSSDAFEAVHPDDLARVEKAFRDGDEGRTVEVEYRLLRPDGSIRWLRVHTYPLFDENGAVFRSINLAEDFTERKNIEEALKLSEEKFNRAFLISPDAITITRASDGLVVEVNESLVKATGFSREEVIGRTTTDLNLWVNLKERDEADAAIKKIGRLKNFRTRFRIKSGEIRSFLLSGEIYEASGDQYILGILRDVTEQDQADEILKDKERILRENETRYRELFEHSPVSLWEEDYSIVQQRLEELRRQGVTDFQAYFNRHFDLVKELASLVKVVDVNQTALETYEASSKAELLTNLNRVFTEESYETFLPELVNIAEGKKEFGWDGINQTLKGRPISISLRWSVVPGHEKDLSTVIVSIIDATARKQAEIKMERQLQFLTALRNIDLAITSTFDIRLSLNALLSQAVSLLSTDAATVLLHRPELRTLQCAVSIGFKSPSPLFDSIRIDASFAGRAVKERRIIHIPDLNKESESPSLLALLSNEGFVSYYGAPLVVKGKVVGVLELFQRSVVERDQDWMDFLNTLAGQAAIAIDNSRMFDSVQQTNLELAMAYDATIEGWSHALDLRDKETEGHTLRVADKTLALAALMNIDDAQKVHMRWGALLHDIGKLGVPDQILFKPAALNDEEWAVMRKHPVFAYEMLAPIEYLKGAIDIPYCHHEKWDGTGYPRGLKGEQIPLAARIFAVVDIWDALNSDRPYRAAWPKEQVRQHIQSLAGSHLDPQVVQVFLGSGLI